MKTRIERTWQFLYRHRGRIAKGCLFLAGMIHAFDAPLVKAKRIRSPK